MSESDQNEVVWTGVRERLRKIIFYSEGPWEKLFDLALICTILASVSVVMLESISWIREEWSYELHVAEWFFTILFTIEYVIRLYVARNAKRYACSFFGVVDALSILPTFLDLIFPGSRFLMPVRALRVLRVFRVLKLTHYVGEANVLVKAVRESGRKITVFIFCVVTLATILGAIMYLVEGEENGFTSIPKSVYWAIVTLTTVGYGDISPQTTVGQVFASMIMIMGYGIIAVPTGIVTAEITRASANMRKLLACHECGEQEHDSDAIFCKTCGQVLRREK